MTEPHAPPMLIRYAFTDTIVGRMLAAASPRGVCSLMLGDNDDQLLIELHERFPRAAMEHDAPFLAPWMEMIRKHLDEGDEQASPPLDMQGTTFQLRVWTALQDIPRGETRSYAQIAEAIGAPAAVRAVGRACAMNKIAILIPCHRVVRSDGMLAGFRWGVERKRLLLETERGMTAGKMSA